MKHSEALSRIQEFRRGTLSRDERDCVQQHLVKCQACARLASRMDFDAPTPDLTPAVMEALMAQPVWQAAPALVGIDGVAPTGRPVQATPAWVWQALALAALLLAGSAFWRPEVGWLKADQGFALDDRPSVGALMGGQR